MAVKMPSGRRDQAWLQQADQSRAALSALWVGYRETRRALLRATGITTEHIELDLAKISFDIADEHRQALQAEKARIMTQLDKRKPPISAQDPGVTQRAIWNLRTCGPRELPMQAKTKSKTRAKPVAKSVDEDHTNAVHTEEVATTLPKLAMKPESVQVFRRMFPSTDDENAPEPSSTVDWRKFLAALTDAGFSSRHNTGSAVTFSNEKGRIVFQKPHPVAKIDHHMLLRFGKRLNKWFGLGRESLMAT